jgi:hypothetical protein
MTITIRNYRWILLEALGYFALMAASLGLSLYKVTTTGPLWPDSPRYANGGAMVHDWLASGIPVDVYHFAQANYARYPAFSLPFHPPAYPVLLGGWFWMTGVSYLAGRVFVATCLGATACLIAFILRRLGAVQSAAMGCAVLWLTTPEVVRWSRDTMSEVPSMALMLGASLVFLTWLDSPSPRSGRIWGAFVLAGLAFFSRVTTAGVLPCWFLYAAVTGRGRRMISRPVILALILYLVAGGGYVRFAGTFSRHEVAADGKGQGPTIENLATFAACLPEAATWGTTALAVAGLVAAIILGGRSRVMTFGLCWLAAYAGFKLAMPTSPEIRHIFGALPALPFLASCLWDQRFPEVVRRGLTPMLLVLAVAANLYQDSYLPRGVVGYSEVARLLASQGRPGNVLLACPEDQELIFRYREATSDAERIMVRADRTLAIRVSSYANVPPRILAREANDLLQVVRDGRIRYLVTTESDSAGTDRRTEEMVLAHTTVLGRPGEFRRVGEAPLLVQYNRPGRALRVVIWEYLGNLPDGPSTLPVIIPTAGMKLESTR